MSKKPYAQRAIFYQYYLFGANDLTTLNVSSCLFHEISIVDCRNLIDAFLYSVRRKH